MFIFRVEGTGVLHPADIVLTALEVLGKKISALQVRVRCEDVGGVAGGRRCDGAGCEQSWGVTELAAHAAVGT